jgi:uncharacterized protein
MMEGTMSDPITLRPAEADDLDAMAALNRAAVPAVSDVDDLALWRLIEQATPALVATEDGHVVAFVIALGPGVDYDSPNYRFFAERHASFSYIDRVVVDPLYARRGIGARLYDAVAADAVQRGVPVVTAEVNVRPPTRHRWPSTPPRGSWAWASRTPRAGASGCGCSCANWPDWARGGIRGRRVEHVPLRAPWGCSV